MQDNALRIDERDNVVIAVQPLFKGAPVVVDGQRLFEAADDVELGHKLALVSIAAGEPVYRYGQPILQAARAIRRGEWVHVHNTRPVPGDSQE